MPNRIIKESICESSNLNECDPATREFFTRLITYADDYGRFNADLIIMRARLYPREVEELTLAEIEEMLLELADNDLIKFYCPMQRATEAVKVYGQIIEWDKHQRVRYTKAKQPIPEKADWLDSWSLHQFIPAAVRDAVFERDGFTCQQCGFALKFPSGLTDLRRRRKSVRGLLHIDPLTPIFSGGLASAENLRVLCRDCNAERPRKIQPMAAALLAQRSGADFPVQRDLPQSAASCGDLRQVAATCGKLRQESGSQSQSESRVEENPNPSVRQNFPKEQQPAEPAIKRERTEIPKPREQFQKFWGPMEGYLRKQVVEDVFLRKYSGWQLLDLTHESVVLAIPQFSGEDLARDGSRIAEGIASLIESAGTGLMRGRNVRLVPIEGSS